MADFIRRGGVVVTSNFDLLIENAYKELYGRELLKIAFPIGEEDIVSRSNLDSLLIKYHGCVSSIDKIGIDVENLEFEGFKGREEVLFNKIFQDKENLVFIGSSLSDSLDFLPSVGRLKQSFRVVVFDYDPTCESSYSVSKASVTNLRNSSKFFSLYWFLGEKIDDAVVIVKDKDNSVFAKFINNRKALAEKTKNRSYFPNLDSRTMEVLRLYVLKVMGLLTLVGEKDIRKLEGIKDSNLDAIVDEIISYWENIVGNYKYNLSRRKNRCDYLDSLTEVVFYSDANIMERILGYFLGLFLSVKCYKSWKKRKRDIRLFRSWFHFMLRNFYIFPFLAAIIRIDKFIRFQKDLSLHKKDIYLYRFSLKEEVRYLLKRNRFEEAYKKWKEAFILSVDTDYFIEASNLLRLWYMETKDRNIRREAVYMPFLYRDSLNLGKILRFLSKESVPIWLRYVI